MSSSYRSGIRGWVDGPGLLALLGLLGAWATAHGADIYLQPSASATVETDSNVDLDPGGNTRKEGYLTDAAALIGVATPDSETTVKPRLRYQRYPQETQLNRLEGTLDLNSHVSSQRGSFSLLGRYDHLNDTEAESPSALYNDVNPTTPITADSGRAVVGITRDYVLLQPRYSYRVTPLVSVGASGNYQNTSFSPSDISSHVGYSYAKGDFFVSRQIGARAEVSAGASYSRYDARKVASTATSTGGTIGFDYNWSRTFGSFATLTFQHSDINSKLLPPFQGSQQNWGGTAGLSWKAQAQEVRVNIGRALTPGSGGGLYATDQIQAEYDRDLTERLSYVVAVRGLRTNGLTSNVSSFDRDYARGDASVKWMITRTWMVQGGISYAWQKYRSIPGSADNNQIFVRIGYIGLPRQR